MEKGNYVNDDKKANLLKENAYEFHFGSLGGKSVLSILDGVSFSLLSSSLQATLALLHHEERLHYDRGETLLMTTTTMTFTTVDVALVFFFFSLSFLHFFFHSSRSDRTIRTFDFTFWIP